MLCRLLTISTRLSSALLSLALTCLPAASRAADAAPGHPIKVACVGDSITQGVGTLHPDQESYPAQLQALQGSGWEVHNFGVGGRTLLRKADPLDFGRALKFAPEVVVIALGTNDSKTAIWAAHKEEFVADYVAAIKAFEALPGHPQVWACLPPPAFPGNWTITEEVIRDAVIPAIKKAAETAGIQVIDLQTPLLGSASLFPDKVHPNAEGAKKIAGLVAAQIGKGKATKP